MNSVANKSILLFIQYEIRSEVACRIKLYGNRDSGYGILAIGSS
jgi:hypothetical protein